MILNFDLIWRLKWIYTKKYFSQLTCHKISHTALTKNADIFSLFNTKRLSYNTFLSFQFSGLQHHALPLLTDKKNWWSISNLIKMFNEKSRPDMLYEFNVAAFYLVKLSIKIDIISTFKSSLNGLWQLVCKIPLKWFKKYWVQNNRI